MSRRCEGDLHGFFGRRISRPRLAPGSLLTSLSRTPSVRLSRPECGLASLYSRRQSPISTSLRDLVLEPLHAIRANSRPLSERRYFRAPLTLTSFATSLQKP